MTKTGSWGGARVGAGRKKSRKSRVVHRSRETFNDPSALHITLKLLDGFPNLRWGAEFWAVCDAIFDCKEREGFRIIHYTVLSNHLHLIIEAQDQDHLSRAITALKTRMARGLNKTWDRKGRVFADRYHSVLLRTSRQTRNALAYVLNNARHHGIDLPLRDVDPCSSGDQFLGWDRKPQTLPGDNSWGMVAVPRHPFLTTSLRLHPPVPLAG